MRGALLGVVAGLLAAAPAAADCGDRLAGAASTSIQAPGLTLVFAPRPWPIDVGRHFGVEVVVCASAGMRAPMLLRVDADMPVHRHGMNYRATVRALDEDRYAVDGMMFHMPGRWRFTFELGGAGELRRLVHEVDVE
jgi:hypothetical protein